MKKDVLKKVFFLLILMVSVPVFACNQLGSPMNNSIDGSDKDKKEAIEKLVNRYIQSINEASCEITDEIWMNDDFVTFIGPSGRYSTVQELKENFIIGVWKNKFKDRSLRKLSLQITLSSPTTAWLEFEWEFDATRLSDGGHHHTTGLETQIVRLCDDGQWRLEHVHYSSLKK